MRRLAIVVVALVAGGCGKGDPCAGKSGACLTVEATGSGIGLLDELLVGITDGSGTQQTGQTGTIAPRIELPVRFAAVLRPGTSGAVSIDVSGVRDGTVVADGVADVVIPPSGHASVTVSLGSTTGGDQDMAGGGGDGGGDGDMLLVGPELTPATFDARVDIGQSGKVMFTLDTSVDITLGPIAIVPAVLSLSVDGNSTCKNGMALAAKATCTVIIDYAPTKAESHTVQVQIGTSLGTPTSTLRAMSPGIIVETLAISGPPTFKAVHAVDPVHVWAVGDNNVVYHRAAGGWTSISGPGAPATTLDSVWAASDDEVYVGSTGVFAAFHTTDQGQHWASVDVKLTAGIEAIAGVDANTVYIASGQGEIAVGSAANGFGNDAHAADGSAFADLEVYDGNVFAARAGQVLLRTPAGNPRWSVVLDANTAATFNATWGSTGGDFYAVGTANPCAGSCSALVHQVGGSPPVKQSFPGCDGFYDVWGEPEGGGFGVYAVGLVGTFVTTPNSDVWTAYTTGTTATLYGVRGAAGEIYAVGTAGTILHLVR